ncbi:MAG: cell wall hydrolase [Lachnospiraceae bacterium]|nr:cell wall hydrolase [Lachnospiraceae bacterium]
MLKGRNAFLMLTGLLLSLSMLLGIGIDAAASGTIDYLDSCNVGISNIIAPGSGSTNEEAIEELKQMTEEEEEEENKSDLVMADVKQALNVRAEATEESEKVGLLYKDCGGRILERKDGWTKIQSGDLVGWASDEYLLFDEEAEELAGEVGNLIVTIETETLRVRKEPNLDSKVLGLIAQDDELDVIDVIDDEWISVDFEDDIAYVSSEFVNMDFHIDEGETMEVIKQREEEAAEAKRKAVITANEAIIAEADDVRLLAALIQCEAGSEAYEGKLAVGAVVMNRVRSGAYPSTISGVIYASGQFTPALNGKVANTYNSSISDSCFQAAQEALSGMSNVGDATHFRRAGNHDGILIGHHVFW